MNPNQLAKCPLVLKEFLGYMETIKGKSPKTVQEYFFDLRTFFRYMKIKKNLTAADTEFSEIPIDDITIDFLSMVSLTDVYEFMNFVTIERENKNAARARKSASLRAFFQYLTNKTHQLKENPVQELETPKQKKSLPKYLTLEQSIDLLNAVDGPFRERDYCILTLFLNCGLRLAELVGLNLNDIRRDHTMRVTGKGNKERMIYLNSACQKAIEEYLKVRPNPMSVSDKKALFISHLNKRLGRQAVQNIVQKYLKKIGLDGQGYSAHKLRHTAATLMYQHGNVDIRVLKDILGHQNLGTTEIYTHLSNQQMEDAADANPLSKVEMSSSKHKKSE